MRLTAIRSAPDTIRPEGGCDSCPRGLRGFDPGNPRDARVLVVHEHPGVDRQRWDEIADAAGVTDRAWTGAVHCTADGSADGRSLRACLNQHVRHEAKGYPVVVLAGGGPISQFYPDVRAAKMRGNMAVHPDFPGQRFYATAHPGWVARDPKERTPALRRQLDRLARVLDEPADPPWRIIRGPSAVDALKRMVARDLFSFDLETDGLRSWHPDTKVLSLAVCVDEREAAFVHRDDPWWDDALAAVAAGLERRDATVLGHNIGFDLDVMERRTGCFVRARPADTQNLIYHALQRKMIGLKEATADLLDGYRFLVHAPHRCRDVEHLARYNTEDVVRSLQLWMLLFPDLPARTRDLLLRASSPAAFALSRLSSNGMRYDPEAGEALEADIRRRMAAELDAWRKEDPSFDPDGRYAPDSLLSGDALIEYVYGEDGLGLPVIATTDKSGKPSTTKSTFNQLVSAEDTAERARPLRHLLEIGRLEKQRNTFVEPFVTGKKVEEDGRVHASFVNTNVDTGRSASFNPNMQNITRNDPDPDVEHNPRDGFTASPGNIVLQVDYSQIELREAMCLSEDPVGIQAYLDGKDLHQQTGEVLAERAGEEMTKSHRTNAKIINFSLIYGGTDYTVRRYARDAFGIEMPVREAREYVDVFFGTYRRLPPWHREIVQDVRDRRGFLTSVLGHTWHYPDWDHPTDSVREHAERSAINATCQGPAGFLTLLTLYLVQQHLRETGLHPRVRTCNSVHDSIMLDVPPDEVEAVRDRALAPAVEEVREWIRPWFVVPLAADIEIGPDWGHLEERPEMRIEYA